MRYIILCVTVKHPSWVRSPVLDYNMFFIVEPYKYGQGRKMKKQYNGIWY